jgi:hypothetical protein
MKTLAQKVLAGRSSGHACLTEIVNNAAQFVSYLSQRDPMLAQWETLEPDWIAEVYQAVAVGLGADPRPEGANQALFQADRSDREAVGRAFREVLVPSLPTTSGIHRLAQSLQTSGGGVPRRGSVDHEPDVLSGGPDAARLAEFGVTPVDLVLASDGVGMLLERATHADAFQAGKPLTVHMNHGRVAFVDQSGAATTLTRAHLVDEVALMTDLDPARAAVLLDWLALASGSVPALFMGFDTAFDMKGLTMQPIARTAAQDNLFQRWRASTAS